MNANAWILLSVFFWCKLNNNQNQNYSWVGIKYKCLETTINPPTTTKQTQNCIKEFRNELYLEKQGVSMYEYNMTTLSSLV